MYHYALRCSAIATYHDGQYSVTTTGAQGSGRLLSLVGANVLIVLPVGRGDFAKGEVVEEVVAEEIRGGDLAA